MALHTVQRWVARAGDLPLDEVDWNSRPAGCRAAPRRTKLGVEHRILVIRRRLRTKSDLGEYGPEAIRREMQLLGERAIPSVATIARILLRRGALDGRKRIRCQVPPPGWFLAEIAAKRAEMDRFDAIEDLVIRGGIDVNVLTGISLHGGLCAAWTAPQITAKFTVDCRLDHWRAWGLPRYAKFDNATVSQGAHKWPDTFGRVTGMCLSLNVIPVFAPPLSRGFQPDIEAFNWRCQDAVWSRFTFRDRAALMLQSNRFAPAHPKHYAVRIDDAPARKPFPKNWRLDLHRPLKGTVVYIRETNARGQAAVLGRIFDVTSIWTNRLVRADVDLRHHLIRFYALRRRDTHNQLLLATHAYAVPTKRFHG